LATVAPPGRAGLLSWIFGAKPDGLSPGSTDHAKLSSWTITAAAPAIGSTATMPQSAAVPLPISRLAVYSDPSIDA
jgi:hypothetical protein